MTASSGGSGRSYKGVPRTPQGWARQFNPAEPSYRRVTQEEVCRYVRLHRNGRSGRLIGRCYGRSHITVARWLAREGSIFREQLFS